MRGTLKCCAIRAPAFGEHRINMLNDIATLTGGQLVTSGDGMNSASKADALLKGNIFGTCKKIVIDKGKTTFIGAAGAKDDIHRRELTIREQLNDPTLEANAQGMLRERLGKLAGGVAILRVGGSTEIELMERKYRVEDALNATQAAIAEGIVPGGGVALTRAVHALEGLNTSVLTSGEKLGIKLIHDACHAPLRYIVQNAGVTHPIIVENEVKKNPSTTFGYDAMNDAYVDVIKAGIIDPVKVTRTAIENAASVAGLLLTVNALVLDVTEPEINLAPR
jgi:chaperonin GroEL